MSAQGVSSREVLAQRSSFQSESSSSSQHAEVLQRLGNIEGELRLLRVPLPSRCLSVKEVAQTLGLSPAAVQGLINRDELAALQLQLGGRKIYRVQLTDLNAFIEAKKKPAAWIANDETIFTVPDWTDYSRSGPTRP